MAYKRQIIKQQVRLMKNTQQVVSNVQKNNTYNPKKPTK
jgi:hypothetical protein